jgi:glycosyltransferase involved in cell wall biosynthesis
VYLAPGPAFKRASDTTRAAWRRADQRRLGLPERFVLGVGYEARKNIPLLIDAFAAHCARLDPMLGLVIVVAEPATAEAFTRMARERGIADRTLVLGSRAADEMARLYNLAEVFAFPSARESFGLPPLEALACGTPVITTRGSSLPEIVGDAALLIEPGSKEALGAALVAVLTDPVRRQQMETRGLERARRFSWHQTALKTLAVYEEAVCS